MDNLVNLLKRHNIIKTPQVSNVMNKLDRNLFNILNPYADAPQPIGDHVTISAPHMHASALEECLSALKYKTTTKPKILDIGSGSGYITIAFYLLLKEMGIEGDVWGIEIIDHLVTSSRIICEKMNLPIKILKGDGKLGLPSEGPFDFIHVGACIKDNNAKLTLIKQLKTGSGVLIAPIYTKWTIIKKLNEDNTYSEEFIMEVRFVDLK